jgi:AraC-like DNA-binding protein
MDQAGHTARAGLRFGAPDHAVPLRLEPPPLARRGLVNPVHYAPPAGYGLDVELYTAVELRRRVLSVAQRGIERPDFNCLVYVTAGRYTHMLDFETLECAPGSVLAVQPGQVHCFGEMAGWQGWALVFRAELLQSRQASKAVEDLDLLRDVADLPAHMRLAGSARQAVTMAFERMAQDAALHASAPAVNALLRHQLQALLVRLHLAHASAPRVARVDPILLQRFRRFRTAVEREYRRWHSVAQYARDLACSPKSLNRATLALTDVGAKAFLTQRVVLEARRLLVHTVSPVATIGDQLGFDEATNFVKFFRRETGLTPGAFRANQRAR